jgi:CubicO group peptidase (beta-lactamase class C family)
MADPRGNRSAEVRRLLEAAVRAGLTPGAVAVWSTGSSATDADGAAAGVTHFGPGRPPTSRRVWYDLASLTKPLVVTSLFLLARRTQLVDVGTAVGEVVPELTATALGDVSIQALLTHTSPLSPWAPLYALTAGDRGRLLECLPRLVSRPRSPRVAYSCLGFILLGVVLERVLGADLERLFVRHVLHPTGLDKELGFRPDAGSCLIAGGAMSTRLEQQMTRDDLLDPDSVPPLRFGLPDDGNARFLGGVAGNAGLFGSADGVHKLAMQYLPRVSALFSPPEIDIAVRCHTEGLEQARGLGWQLASSHGCSAGAAISPIGFGHVGHTGTSLWIDPQREAVVVLLSNRHHPDHRDVDLHPLRRRLNDLVLG